MNSKHKAIQNVKKDLILSPKIKPTLEIPKSPKIQGNPYKKALA